MASRNTLPDIPGGLGILGDAIGPETVPSQSPKSPAHRTAREEPASFSRTPSKSRPRSHTAPEPPLKVKVPFNLPRELAEELRDAVFALSGPPHCLSLAALAEKALRAELARLRRAANEGHRFAARSGSLKPGRRIE